jgi:alpha-1,3-mannosyltransferase
MQHDWVTYVANGDAFLDGVRDYSKLWGPTGYAAYPAGYCYLYGLLSHLKISASFHSSQLLMGLVHTVQTFAFMAIVEKSIRPMKL